MPATTRVTLNRRGIDTILRSTDDPRLAADLNRRGAAIASAAGRGYGSDGWLGRRRYRVNVHSNEPVVVSRARPVLLGALDAGRGG
jgi:hypothetical protein